MSLRFSFFGLISSRSPMLGLLEHYEQIGKGMALIEESMECYISGVADKSCKDFNVLQNELNAAEDHADTIKRYIRNHLPKSIFLPVEKHLFFSYTRAQDDILDAGQAALQWLALRDVLVPEEHQRDLIFFLAEVTKSIKLLRPALVGTIAWVNNEDIDRDEVKQHYRDVRAQHKVVTQMSHALNSKLYRSSLDFKDIYQLIHFVEHLNKMSHSAEGCADLLRIMIAK